MKLRAEGWPLVGMAAAALAAMTVALLAAAGVDEAGLRLVLRATARTSVVLFTAAFVAAAAYRTWPSPATRWLLRNRRYVGVSFAVSHGIHLVAIVVLVARYAPRIPLLVWIPGSVTYLFIAAMAATSFDRSAAWLGRRRWRILHTVGVHVIWAVFAFNYVLLPARWLGYLPFTLLVVAAPALRLAARRSEPAASKVA